MKTSLIPTNRERRSISLYRRLIEVSFVLDAWRIRASLAKGHVRKSYRRVVATIRKRQNRLQAEFNKSVIWNKENDALADILQDFIEMAELDRWSIVKENDTKCIRWAVQSLTNMRTWQ